MEERKCFECGVFGHIASNCRNVGKEEPVLVFLNRFEVLKARVMQKGEGSGKEMAKDRREILREEKVKRGVEVRQTKVERKEKKEKTLREVVMKIGLKQKEDEEEVVIEALLDSGATGLVISEEFVKKHRFRRTKLERPVYVRNVDGMLNYAGPIVDIVNVKIVDNGLYFIFPFHFIFLVFFSFSFSIFRTTQVRVYQSRCHISHKLMA